MEVVEIQQGVPYKADLVFWNDTVDPAVLLDITGLTVFISIKKLTDFRQDDNEALITSEIIIHTDPIAGETEWELTAVQTLISLKRYKADVRLYTDALTFVNSAQFYVDIIPVVTRRLT